MLLCCLQSLAFSQKVKCDNLSELKILSEMPIVSSQSQVHYFWFNVDSAFYDMRFLVDSSCRIEYDFYDYFKFCSTKDTILPEIGYTTFDRVLTTEEISNGQCFCSNCSKNRRIHLAHGKRYVVKIESDCDSIFIDTRITDDILALQREKKLKWYQRKYKKGDRLVLNNILFHANSVNLLSKSKGELQDLLYLLKNNPTLAIEIQGHVNAPGEKNTDNNQALSEGRAKAIYDYLLKNGVEKNRVGYKGFGNTQMIFPNAKLELEMKMNRRVEILVVGS